MRWFWIDRFDEFVRGKHATAVKNVSLAEEHMHDHFPGAALMPNSLIVEGMAQTAGLLVAMPSTTTVASCSRRWLRPSFISMPFPVTRSASGPRSSTSSPAGR